MLWGIKYFYQYLNSTTTNKDVAIPQYGSFTSTNAAGGDTFTGHVVVDSLQTTLKSEMALMPFIGHAFDKSYVYLGLGPALFNTQTNFYGSTGYADINGVHTDITSTPDDFKNNNWIWGGAAQLGMDYYFSPSWFLDVNYTYARTQNYHVSDSAPFTSQTTSASKTYTTRGTLYLKDSEHFSAQTVSVSINKTFG